MIGDLKSSFRPACLPAGFKLWALGLILFWAYFNKYGVIAFCQIA